MHVQTHTALPSHPKQGVPLAGGRPLHMHSSCQSENVPLVLSNSVGELSPFVHHTRSSTNDYDFRAPAHFLHRLPNASPVTPLRNELGWRRSLRPIAPFSDRLRPLTLIDTATMSSSSLRRVPASAKAEDSRGSFPFAMIRVSCSVYTTSSGERVPRHFDPGSTPELACHLGALSRPHSHPHRRRVPVSRKCSGEKVPRKAGGFDTLREEAL